MKKVYNVGQTIEVAEGHARVPEGNYVVLGIGNDVSGNDPTKYPKIYECQEAKSRRIFHIHESDLEETVAPVNTVQHPMAEEATKQTEPEVTEKEEKED